MGSFKRSFLGYRRAEVDVAILSRESRIGVLEREVAGIAGEMERMAAKAAIELKRNAAKAAAQLEQEALPNVGVLVGDFLDAQVDLDADRMPSALRVAGNLPYNVASPILFKLADMYAGGVPLLDATVMLQREVADRLIAAPGTKEYGVLTVLIRHGATVTRLLNLPSGAFRPAPKVLMRGRALWVRPIKRSRTSGRFRYFRICPCAMVRPQRP